MRIIEDVYRGDLVVYFRVYIRVVIKASIKFNTRYIAKSYQFALFDRSKLNSKGWWLVNY